MADEPADEFLRLACLTYENDGPERWEQARQLLTAHPEIARASIHTVAKGDRTMAELLLSRGADPDLHDARFDSTPLG